MHMLDAVLVHQSLCNSMKRIVALVKVWFIIMLCVLIHVHTFLVGFVMPGCMNHVVARGFIQNCHYYRRHSHTE